MKKLILGLLSLLLITGTLVAQDGKKDFKDAKRALGAFNLDPNGNKDKLKEAFTAIVSALNDEEVKNDPEAWNLKGEIFNEIANQIVAVRQLGMGSLEDLPKVSDPAMEASQAFRKALTMAEKKYQTKDALKGLRAAQNNLNNLGYYHYEDQEFAEAHNNFKETLEAHKVLKENGEESSLDDEEDFKSQIFTTGLTALSAGMDEAAAPYFEELYKMKYDKPTVYEALYQIHAKKDGAEAAYHYLEEGRKLFPEEISLLFADINHYLKIGKLDILISKLETAIEKEPDNISLYNTTGSVYDQLYQKAYEEGQTEQATEYFDKALEYYKKAQEKDPGNFDAIYSMGALYYNKAAVLTKGLQELADDYSKEGIKKYEALQEKIFAEFDHALPYFKRCEQINPNDMSTLIALKEIFARKNDLETSNIFKERLENVQGGGTNDSSYFKE